jgi:hypothetical protein
VSDEYLKLNSNAFEARTRHLKREEPLAVFAHSGLQRSGAPTLVPVRHGGRPALAQILLVNISEQEATDRLWRRETNRIGLIIDRYENVEGMEVVLAARFAAAIIPLTPVHLAELAIKSARLERTGRDSIAYLIDAKRNSMRMPLSDADERETLSRTQACDQGDAIRKIGTEA